MPFVVAERMPEVMVGPSTPMGYPKAKTGLPISDVGTLPFDLKGDKASVETSSPVRTSGGGKGYSSSSSTTVSTHSSARSLLSFRPTTVAGYCLPGSPGKVTDTFHPGGATCADVKMCTRSVISSSSSSSSLKSSNATTRPDPCEFSILTPLDVTRTTEGRTARAAWIVGGSSIAMEFVSMNGGGGGGGGGPPFRGGDRSMTGGPPVPPPPPRMDCGPYVVESGTNWEEVDVVLVVVPRRSPPGSFGTEVPPPPPVARLFMLLITSASKD
mmetsp:Transcript_1688/g.3742  ORF Transcript_1688/g.3742 Transcript_1688/m.3742 type:complete len:270 (+) Transcript_1688:1213-2022(+)